MKRIALSLALLLPSVNAAHALNSSINRTAKLGPAIATLAVWAPAEQAVTLALGATARNCLSSISMTSSSNFTLRVLDGGTTIYAVDVATSVVTTGGGGAVFNRDFLNDDMCGTLSTALIVKITTAASQGASASTQKLNYTGFQY